MIEISQKILVMLENIDAVPTKKFKGALYFDISANDIQYLKNLCLQLEDEFKLSNSDSENLKISTYFLNAERLIKHSYIINKRRTDYTIEK